jgi:hypothetical protein
MIGSAMPRIAIEGYARSTERLRAIFSAIANEMRRANAR